VELVSAHFLAATITAWPIQALTEHRRACSRRPAGALPGDGGGAYGPGGFREWPAAAFERAPSRGWSGELPAAQTRIGSGFLPGGPGRGGLAPFGGRGPGGAQGFPSPAGRGPDFGGPGGAAPPMGHFGADRTSGFAAMGGGPASAHGGGGGGGGWDRGRPAPGFDAGRAVGRAVPVGGGGAPGGPGLPHMAGGGGGGGGGAPPGAGQRPRGQLVPAPGGGWEVSTLPAPAAPPPPPPPPPGPGFAPGRALPPQLRGEGGLPPAPFRGAGGPGMPPGPRMGAPARGGFGPPGASAAQVPGMGAGPLAGPRGPAGPLGSAGLGPLQAHPPGPPLPSGAVARAPGADAAALARRRRSLQARVRRQALGVVVVPELATDQARPRAAPARLGYNRV